MTMPTAADNESLSIHAYPVPDESAPAERRAAYAAALEADTYLRNLLEQGVAIPPGKLRQAEDRCLATLLSYASLA